MYEQLIIKSKGKEFVCMYDQEDHDLISQFTWSLHSDGYAVTFISGKPVLMHRLILGIVNSPQVEADHIFHNRLDNRRAMIRICTRSENRRNSRKIMKGSSKYKGVYRDGKFYHSQILQRGGVKNLGRYFSEATAGKVYDAAAKEEFQDFAFLNFPGYVAPRQLTLPILHQDNKNKHTSNGNKQHNTTDSLQKGSTLQGYT